jgi:hypothetical protein
MAPLQGRQITRTDHALKAWVFPLDFRMFHRHVRSKRWKHWNWNRRKRRKSGAGSQSTHRWLQKRRKPRKRSGSISIRNAYTRRSGISRSILSAKPLGGALSVILVQRFSGETRSGFRPRSPASRVPMARCDVPLLANSWLPTIAMPARWLQSSTRTRRTRGWVRHRDRLVQGKKHRQNERP